MPIAGQQLTGIFLTSGGDGGNDGHCDNDTDEDNVGNDDGVDDHHGA